MIAALVPAAGASVRMGRPKLLFEFDGQALISRVVSALSAGGAARVVVIAPPADSPEGPAIAALARGAGAEVVVPRTRPAEMRQSIEL
jgi:molybdenum cofactor cytidylyltransferase